MPHAALVHDNFTGPTGMGLVLERHARWLLDGGWSLTLVGDNVPADLAESCKVVSVPKPRRLPSLAEHIAWCSRARRALRQVRADLIHVHSPLLAPQADLMTSHFMSYPSHKRGARELSSGPSGALRRVQALLDRLVDHRAYCDLAGRTYISFVSEFLRDEFETWYGPPRGGWIFAPPAPPWDPPAAAERLEARAQFGIGEDALCVGYLGGSDPRKGWPALSELTQTDEITLLFAGPGSEQLRIGGRRGIGFVDVDAFHAACDVIAAPAVFDSAPVALLQAIARDVPVVTTAQCGWASAIARTGAGVVWDRRELLNSAVRRAAETSSREKRRRFLAEFSDRCQSAKVLEAYSAILEQPLGGPATNVRSSFVVDQRDVLLRGGPRAAA